MTTPFHRRLYLRIWLAVVAAVVVLALVAGWLSRMEFERERSERERERAERPGREIILRNPAGELLGRANLRETRVPGRGLEFEVPMKDGSSLIVQLPRPVRPGGPGPGGPYGMGAGGPPDGSPPGMGSSGGPARLREPPTRLPFSMPWMLVLVAAVVAAVTYPIVRRLTKRLETVQQGVERWGAGDLSARLAEEGGDEVAFLAARFNHAARQIESLLNQQKTLLASQTALLVSQKSLLANASHELRSPLTRIRMGLEMLPGQLSNPQKSGFSGDAALDEIKRNIAELDQLIEEILLASRLDAQEADMGLVEAVDLVGLAAEESARADAQLDVQGGANPSGPAATNELVVQGVAKLLRRALRNLLENARRHGTGEIHVSLQRQTQAGVSVAVIQVMDQGPGVPPALRERIFEPFYRLPGASEQGGGVGLGLALVKSIALRHGGTVACGQAPGQNQGACFTLTLPVA